MKKIGLVVFFSCFIFAKVASQAGNPVVVIAPFEAQGVSAEEANVITEMFTSEYATTGLASVVDRNSFDKIKRELSFQASDWSNSNKVAELGRALNASQVIVGTITSFRGQVIVSIKVIDINSTTILASHAEKLQKIDSIIDRIPKICKTLASKARSASKKDGNKSGAVITSSSVSPVAEKTHAFYVAPVLGYDSFIVGNTCSIGADFKYKHKSGFSVWANNAVLLGTAKYEEFEYRFSDEINYHGDLIRRTNERYSSNSPKSLFSAGVSTEVMLGYSKAFGAHNIGLGAGYQGAITKHFYEAYAFAFRFEYSYINPERNIGFIMAITDGIGYIRHKEGVGNTIIDDKTEKNTYTIHHNQTIRKYISANNRFSLKLGIVFTP